MTWLSASRSATRKLALGMAALGVAVAFAGKYQCVLHGWSDNYQYTHLCYNEIQALFGVRGIQAGLLPYRDTAFEYPVLTGMFMDLAGRVLRGLVRLGVLPANSDGGYLLVSSVMLAPFSVAVTLLLRPLVPARRLALWAIGLPTLLYTFHNWDVLAVWGAAWGLAAYERDRHGTAGAALAAGASAKLYPAFLAPGAVLARWAEGDRRGSIRLVAGFALTYAALNVPWILLGAGEPSVVPADFPGVAVRDTATNGWLGVWLFHADRYPDYWTVWYWIAEHFSGIRDHPPWGNEFKDFVSLSSFGLFAAATVLLLWWGWRRRTEPDGYPVAATGLGIVTAFLLTSKVYSPQYALWAVPLLVLLNIPYRYVLAYFAAELAVLVSGFAWFTEFDDPDAGWKGALEVAVWARAAILAVLLWQSTRAARSRPAAGSPAPAEVASRSR
ncbi:MAG TPA: glycosyltransferase 87 family protein [Actinomycetota bacterium]|nr:glycosyltransferase 87 family protein [Actinomycetota bacterium]